MNGGAVHLRFQMKNTAFSEAAEKPLHHGRPINSSKIVDEFSYNY